jgi:histidinol-phosphate aminotransferase
VIYAAKQGAVARTVELSEHRYDLDALLDAVTPRTKLVYICHPNNPTGTMNTADELDRYFERVPEHVLTVVDQAYFEYIDRPDYPDAIERYLKAGRQVAVLRTFSKIYGLAGLRVGYAVAPGNVVCAGLAPVPSVGNFVYVDTGGDANVLFEQLLREGIIVRPLTGFGATTAIRISVGAPDELDHLAVALARVLQPA